VLDDGAVVDPATGRRLAYGALLAQAMAAPLPTDAVPVAPADWKIIGKDSAGWTGGKVRGKAPFGIDVQVPGMKIATLAQSPVFGGKLARHDAAAAKAVPASST
jgi:isoquinoline 1-oxidoreductase beta subunit